MQLITLGSRFGVPCAFDPATGSFTLGSAPVQITVADIRARYGSGDLMVYLFENGPNPLVGVFPATDLKRFDANTDNRPTAFIACIPEGALAWMDAGVKVIQVLLATQEQEKVITVAANEPVTENNVLAFLGNTKTGNDWHFLLGAEITIEDL